MEDAEAYRKFGKDVVSEIGSDGLFELTWQGKDCRNEFYFTKHLICQGHEIGHDMGQLAWFLSKNKTGLKLMRHNGLYFDGILYDGKGYIFDPCGLLINR